MYLLLSFLSQLLGFYILYSASARAVFVKGKLAGWSGKNLRLAKTLGSLLLLASTLAFIMELGMGVGFLFALMRLMAVSSFTIVLLPLRRHKTTRY